MPDAPIIIIPALREHDAAIRVQSAGTHALHRARLPHVFGPTNSYQDDLLDMAYDTASQHGSQYRSRILVACQGETPVGYALVIWSHPQTAQDTSTAMIADIATFDGHRSQGVGKALLAYLHAQMDAMQWDSILADVWAGNDASHALFKDAGFTPERTEYRIGQPAPLTEKAADPTAGAAGQIGLANKWMIPLILLLFAALIVSIP